MEYIFKGKHIPENQRTDEILRQTDDGGNSLVMIWIKETNKEIPQYLMYPGFQKHLNKTKQNAIMYWIMNRLKEDIPECLLYDKCEQQIDYEGWNSAMYYINFRNSPFPNWMIYNGMGECQDEVSKQIPAMMYLEHVRIPPPSCLAFDGIKKHVDINGNDFMMYWIMFLNNDKPPYFLKQGQIFSKVSDKSTTDFVNNKLVNKFNQTPQIYWIVSRKKILPKWLIYKGMEKHIDNDGDNLAMLWVQILKTFPPKYLIYKGIGKQINKKGETLMSLVQKLKKERSKTATKIFVRKES